MSSFLLNDAPLFHNPPPSSSPVHGKVPLPTLDASEVQEVRKELVDIRDKVNTLLNALDGAASNSDSTAQPTLTTNAAKASNTSKQSAPISTVEVTPRQGVRHSCHCVVLIPCSLHPLLCRNYCCFVPIDKVLLTVCMYMYRMLHHAFCL